jgi:Flp pilus assembly secretin CpaC
MQQGIGKLVVAAVMLVFAAIPGARAEDDGPLELGVGTAFRLFLEQAFQTVIVGNQGVVDVRTDDDRSVVVEPLAAGQTNLVFVDARGVVIANVRISVCAPASKGCTAGHAS